MSKKKNTIENKNIIEGKIADDTPLLSYNPLMGNLAMTTDNELEIKHELIEEVQSIAVLNKQVLDAKRKQVELEVDNKKLDAANKLIDGINIVADKALNEETINKMLDKENLNPMDLKFMAEAMEKMSNTLKSLMNPSVADEYGNRKRTKIVAQFQSPSGEKTSIGVEMND